MLSVDFMEGNEWESVQECRMVQPSYQIIFFWYNFVNWVRVYIEDHTLSMIDLRGWLTCSFAA